MGENSKMASLTIGKKKPLIFRVSSLTKSQLMDLKSKYHPPFVKTILLQSLQFLFMEIFTHAKIITYRVCAVTSVSDH